MVIGLKKNSGAVVYSNSTVLAIRGLQSVRQNLVIMTQFLFDDNC